MSQYRRFHHLAAVVTLGAFAGAGCFVVEDTDSDDDDGGAGESGDDGGAGTRGGAGGTRGGSGGAATTGGSSNGGTEQGGGAGAPAGGSGGADAGGAGPAGGTSSGGAGPTGGTSSGGANPTGGAAGTGGSPSGAVMKFCNGLARGEMDVTLTLEFAGVTASALSGTCTPVVPNACIPVPTGANPAVELRDGTEVVLSGSFPTVTVVAGDEMLVLAAIDPDTMMPGLFADTFELLYGAGYTCAETDPVTDVPPTMSRSAPFDLSSQRNLRNVVSPSVYGETRSLGSWVRK